MKCNGISNLSDQRVALGVRVRVRVLSSRTPRVWLAEVVSHVTAFWIPIDETALISHVNKSKIFRIE